MAHVSKAQHGTAALQAPGVHRGDRTLVVVGFDGTKEVDINELEVYMKEKPIRWVDPTGEGAQFDILSWLDRLKKGRTPKA
ncbi:hypothetical protein E2562_002846 [Oryza meyeriana var. granulata]|uniref:Uncharacterized protein n=1 Tax=Oryza meyeriana var. granulata TaxID=110450 RepID=A0A6G1BR09_9ORYZ|nr:hypothetical protein E2562_002846 [Oryza meyeriana var. granulata]